MMTELNEQTNSLFMSKVAMYKNIIYVIIYVTVLYRYLVYRKLLKLRMHQTANEFSSDSI